MCVKKVHLELLLISLKIKILTLLCENIQKFHLVFTSPVTWPFPSPANVQMASIARLVLIHWNYFFLSIFYYDGLWHFQFAEHWALKNTTKMITKKKHVTWASLLLRNDKLHNHSRMPLDPLDHGSRSHSQSVQGTVQSIFYNRRSVLLESDSGRSIWVAGVVVEQE